MTEPGLGVAVDPTPRPFPQKLVHSGSSVTLEPLSESHVPELWEAARNAERSWTYLRYGPFQTRDDMSRHVQDLAQRADQPFWAVRPKSSGRAEGWLSLCDIYPADSAIEVGSVWFSPSLQRTRAATEAVFLLIRHALDELGYKRMVWRCQALNAPSRRAAERYGFKPEGVWRAAAIVKGWQRDVAWYSMLSDEWPSHRAAISAWLDDGNFRADGSAIATVTRLRGPTP
ncbi:GNAT family N-acetyltransferase [Rhizobium sp. LjRoot98]|uniref:GNAT family N-acetyltransferase n=1 Tax=Rhizobium sp. LjRoot98 TaxID=3342345 RepID=UPI003F50C354